jgi:hypothetical protein
MECRGSEGRVVLDEDAVTFHFEGFATLPVKKQASPRRIPLSAIARVECRDVDSRLQRGGYLRLHLVGAPEPEKYRRERDINSMVYLKADQAGPLRELAYEIERRLAVIPRAQDDALLPVADADVRQDIATAANRMSLKLGSKREVRKLPEYLLEGETVRHLAQGSYMSGQGLIVLTDQRLLFVYDGWTSQGSKDFPLNKLRSVQTTFKLGVGTLLLSAESGSLLGHAHVAVSGIPKADLIPLANAVRELLAARPGEHASLTAPSETPAPSASAAHTDPLEQLKKLAELRDAGVLTDQEFEAKKQELLGRL